MLKVMPERPRRLRSTSKRDPNSSSSRRCTSLLRPAHPDHQQQVKETLPARVTLKEEEKWSRVAVPVALSAHTLGERKERHITLNTHTLSTQDETQGSQDLQRAPRPSSTHAHTTQATRGVDDSRVAGVVDEDVLVDGVGVGM